MATVKCVELVKDGAKMWVTPDNVETLRGEGWSDVKTPASTATNPAAKKPAAKKKK